MSDSSREGIERRTAHLDDARAQAHHRGVGPSAARGGAGALREDGLGGHPLLRHARASPSGEQRSNRYFAVLPWSFSRHCFVCATGVRGAHRSALTPPSLRFRFIMAYGGRCVRMGEGGVVGMVRTRTRACSTSWTAGSTAATTPGDPRRRRRGGGGGGGHSRAGTHPESFCRRHIRPQASKHSDPAGRA